MTDPTPPTGPEVDLTKVPKRNPQSEMPNEMLARAQKAAGITPTPPPEPPKEEPKAAPVAATPEPPKEQPKAPAPAPAPAPKPGKKDGIAELREAHERQQSKIGELESSLTATGKEKAEAYRKMADLEAKLAKYEERISKELEPSVQRLSEIEKKLQQKEETLRIKAYTETDEWHEKYVKPIADTEAELNALLGEAVVEIEGQTTQATRDHFDYVMQARSLNDAGNRAETLFGKHVGPQIVNLRARLISLQRKQSEAFKGAQLASMEWEKNQQSAIAQSREMLRNKLNSTKAQLMEAEPTVFKPAEDDNESIGALAEGQKLVELLNNGSPEMTHEQLMEKVALGQVRIMKSYVQDKTIANLTKQLSEAQEALKAYQKSEPDIEGRGSSEPAFTSADPVKDKLLEAASKLAGRFA